MDESPPLHHSAYTQGINRVHSPLLAGALPWLSIMLASLLPQWLPVATAPLLPPLGFLLLVSWRQLRPGLLAVWAGLPLGFFDDLYSGQPFGSAILLWSLTMIVMELVEARLPWRSFIFDWLAASAIIAVYLLASLGLANSAGGHIDAVMIVPQILIGALIFPLMGRMVAQIDRLRLTRFRMLG